MSVVIGWIAAEAELPEHSQVPQSARELGRVLRRKRAERREAAVGDLPAHQFPAKGSGKPGPSFPPFAKNAKDVAPSVEEIARKSKSACDDQEARQFSETSPLLAKDARNGAPSVEELTSGIAEHGAPAETLDAFREREQERRTYRGRTVAMLRRYMRYSIETGRLPSLLGREFFRAKVTSYTVVTFEDRVIFVHDMEACLERLDEFSRQLIARHVLQEHDRWATAKLLHCNEKTVRRLAPLALDRLSEILVERGLMVRLESTRRNSCQGGLEGRNSASDWEHGK